MKYAPVSQLNYNIIFTRKSAVDIKVVFVSEKFLASFSGLFYYIHQDEDSDLVMVWNPSRPNLTL